MKGTSTIDPNLISTKELHQLLLTAIAPRPIAFASTIDLAGKVNLSPFSFFNVFGVNPPILIFSPARRGSNNTTKHSFENVKAVKEVVINTVNYAMVEQMSLSSTEYDKGVNEFIKSGLTPIASVKITPPRVVESPVSFECVVEDIIALGTEGGAGNLVICKIVNIHINQAYQEADGTLDPLKLDLVARLGKNWYSRTTPESLFEIEKPLYTKGIGVDNLPFHAQNSAVLTGNDLGRLGNTSHIPSRETIARTKKESFIKAVLTISNTEEKHKKLHQIAKSYLEKQQPEKALAVLFCI